MGLMNQNMKKCGLLTILLSRRSLSTVRLEDAENREQALMERLSSLERESGKSGVPDDLQQKLNTYDQKIQSMEVAFSRHRDHSPRP